MNKITIYTCAWKRPRILDITLENWTNLKPKPHIVVCGSQGDGCQEIAEKWNCDYFQRPNKPLGNKFNESARRAKDTADYYMIMGSDDLMSQKMWDFYQNYEGDFLGLRDYYFYEMKTGRLVFWQGYPEIQRGQAKHSKHGRPIGAAKMLSHKAMTAIGWEPFKPDRDVSLDHDVDNKIIKTGLKMDCLKHEEVGGMSLDLKSGFNMHSFKVFPNSISLNSLKINELAPDLRMLIDVFNERK